MQSHRGNRFVLACLDGIAVFAIFNAVAWLRGVVAWGEFTTWPLLAPYLFVAAAVYLIDGYRIRTDMMSLDYTSQHLIASVAALIATLLLTYAVIPSSFPLQGSRVVIALSFAALAPLTLSYRRALHAAALTGRRDRAVLFLGDRATCATFRAACEDNRMRQRVLCAVVEDADVPDSAAGEGAETRPYREWIEDVAAGQLAVEAIVLRESSVNLPPAVAESLVELYFAGVPTYTLELFYETYWRKIPLYRINHVWLFQEGFQIARNPVFERTKRGLDVLLSSLGLLVFAPLLLAAALAIRSHDDGPVFFQQMRVGRHRRPFRLLKLRSMRVDADKVPGGLYTAQNDPRITPVGRLLRATRLDEIPQLWNVLKGDMSLIGPRAEWTRLVEVYERDIPSYHFRHLVRPGITGWAQVNYPYGASTEDTLRKLEYDLYYIRHFSFVVDASIILKTIHLMMFGKGR